MWQSKKSLKKTQSLDFDESYYDEEFEEIEEEFGNIGDRQFIEDESSSTTTKSETPESHNVDSIGDTLTTNNSNSREEGEEEEDYEYDYGDEEYSKSFDLHSFHETLAGMNFPKPKLYKNGTRASLTFSNDRVREIERHNQLLLNKIMQNGPSDDGFSKPKVKSKTSKKPIIRSSAEVNRRKQQAKIDYENAILKKKLDKIAFRRPSLS